MINKEVKWGAILSYILIFLNSTYGLIVVPFTLKMIGNSEYGVYKTIGALTATIAIMEFGLGGTLQRFLAHYRARNETENCFNLSAMCMIQAAILAGGMALICFGLFFVIQPVYGTSFTLDELYRAKQIYIVLAIYVVFHIFENVFWGIITGYNRFIFSNSLKIASLVIQLILYFVLLPIFRNSLTIVLISLLLEFTTISIEYLYIRQRLQHKIKLYKWDKAAFIESFRYTFLLFLASIAAQVNNNVDNIIIGAILGAASVAIYSIGLLFFSIFNNLSCAISGVMLPTVINILNQSNAHNNVQNAIIQVGRIQFALLGAAFVGFLIVGKEFLYLWLGDKFEDVYIIVLILMGPALLELCVNVCLAVLRAKNQLGFRTAVVFSTTILNIIITIIGVKIFGYIAAAIGTAVSFTIGSVIIMNLYYYKVLSFNMFVIYREIFRGIWLCLLITGSTAYLSSYFLKGSWSAFLTNVSLFLLLYSGTLLLFGFTKKEKSLIPFINKI